MPSDKRQLPIYHIAAAFGAAIFFLADRILKTLALQPEAATARPLIGDLFVFRFTANYHIAFSLPLGGPWLSLLVALVIIALAAYAGRLGNQPTKKPELLALGLVIAGALSNLIDRLSYGYVIDYLELRYFTVFNLADVMITIGALTLIVRSLRPR